MVALDYPKDAPLSEQLLAQRDAVLFGTWVNRSPKAAGEACLVVRATSEDEGMGLSIDAITILRAILLERGYACPGKAGYGLDPWRWNDEYAQDYVEVLDVLDEAIRRAKEIESEGGER